MRRFQRTAFTCPDPILLIASSRYPIATTVCWSIFNAFTSMGGLAAAVTFRSCRLIRGLSILRVRASQRILITLTRRISYGWRLKAGATRWLRLLECWELSRANMLIGFRSLLRSITMSCYLSEQIRSNSLRNRQRSARARRGCDRSNYLLWIRAEHAPDR